MKLSDTSRPRPTEARAEFQGEPIVFTYDRAKITGDIFEGTTRAGRLAKLLLSWDITNDDGTPFLPTDAALLTMPQDVLRAVEDALWDDFHAGK